jgi:hypothetical protein
LIEEADKRDSKIKVGIELRKARGRHIIPQYLIRPSLWE